MNRIYTYWCDNGLPVFLVSMPQTPLMAAAFVARGGSEYESKDIEGIAHLLEHHMIRGSVKRPSTRAIALPIESVGGKFHAFTNEEVIAFFAHVPPSDKSLLTEALADFILNPQFDPAQMKIELESMIEELRQYGSDPNEMLEVAFAKLLFGSHRAGRSIVGTESSVRSITREKVIEYLRSCFVVSSAAFFIAGNIKKRREVFSEINRLFGSLSVNSPSKKRIEFSDTQTRPRFAIVHYNIPQTKIELGVKCSDITPEDKYPLKVLGAILGTGWTSRLYHELLEKRGLIYAMNLIAPSNGDTSYFAYYGGVKQERWLEVVQVVLSECSRLCAEKVTGEELERAKRMILMHERQDWSDPESAVQYLIQQWAEHDDVTFKDETEGIREVRVKDIMRVAQKFFRDDRLNLAVVGPHRGEERKIRKVLHF